MGKDSLTRVQHNCLGPICLESPGEPTSAWFLLVWEEVQCPERGVFLQLWQFSTEGPVFSSPCVTPDGRSVLCGSHDGRLYCLNVADGSPAWTFQTSAKVYSSPCTFDASVVGGAGLLVATASTDGSLCILDGSDGRALASVTLAGELFSSPVAWGRSLVIGCRNDYIYCLELADKENMKNAEGPVV